MFRNSFLNFFSTLLNLTSKFVKDRLDEGLGNEFSTSSLFVIKPDSETALDELRERNPSENEAKELVENSQETEANPVRKVKFAISGDSIIRDIGFSSKISRVKDAEEEVNKVVGKDEKNE